MSKGDDVVGGALVVIAVVVIVAAVFGSKQLFDALSAIPGKIAAAARSLVPNATESSGGATGYWWNNIGQIRGGGTASAPGGGPLPTPDFGNVTSAAELHALGYTPEQVGLVWDYYNPRNSPDAVLTADEGGAGGIGG